MTKLTEIDYEPGRFDEGPRPALAGAAPTTPKLVPVDYEPEPYDGAAPPPPNQGVVLPSIKRAAGQMVESAGTTLKDITGPNVVSEGLQDFGGGVVKDNPSEIQSFADVLDKPWTTVKEAVAEQVPQLGAAFTGARLGAMAGGLLGPVGAAGGALIGGLAPIFVQEYGEIRGKQKETGEENIPLALGGATAATVLERAGLEKLATKAGAKGVGEALGAIPEGVGRLRHAGQQALKTALIEGPLTEVPQTVIERYAGGQEIGTPEAFDEYAVAGAKGAAGGGAIGGGFGLVAPRVAEQAPQERPPAPGAEPPDEVPGDVDLQDLDAAAQRHMRDILGEGPPLPPAPPPSGPLGRAAQAAGIPVAPPIAPQEGFSGLVDDMGRRQAEIERQRSHDERMKKLQDENQAPELAAQPSARFNPPELRFHKLNAPRTEANARQFAEGLAGRFPQFAFETVPHRLAKNKFVVKVSPRGLDQAAHEAATSPQNDLPQPTESQREAGNYQKGHVRYAGLEISIENPTGSKRSGVGPDGTPWEVEMSAHYGYVKRTEGKDGEQVDVYLASDREDTPAFVVDQIDPQSGKFDEHKTILGATDRAEAESLYDAHFSDGSGPARRGGITELRIEDFRNWLREGDTTKAIASQALVTTPVVESVQATPAAATIDAPQAAALPEGGESMRHDRQSYNQAEALARQTDSAPETAPPAAPYRPRVMVPRPMLTLKR